MAKISNRFQTALFRRLSTGYFPSRGSRGNSMIMFKDKELTAELNYSWGALYDRVSVKILLL